MNELTITKSITTTNQIKDSFEIYTLAEVVYDRDGMFEKLKTIADYKYLISKLRACYAYLLIKQGDILDKIKPDIRRFPDLYILTPNIDPTISALKQYNEQGRMFRAWFMQIVINTADYLTIPEKFKPVTEIVCGFQNPTKGQRRRLFKKKFSRNEPRFVLMKLTYPVQLISYIEQKDPQALLNPKILEKSMNSHRYDSGESYITKTFKPLLDHLLFFFRSLNEHTAGVDFNTYVDEWGDELIKRYFKKDTMVCKGCNTVAIKYAHGLCAKCYKKQHRK